jgi:hypothetical protein
MKRIVFALVAFALVASVSAPKMAEASISAACLGPSGGVPYTLGWWANKHGRAAITQSDLNFMSLQNLVDAEGNPFDPATYDEFRAWLLGGNATNMSYMLSVQFITGVLNVIKGAVSKDLLIYAPGTVAGGADGIATLSAVLHEANNALLAFPYTPAGHPQRAYLEAIKNALDAANNDLNYIQAACL